MKEIKNDDCWCGFIKGYALGFFAGTGIVITTIILHNL